MPAGGQVHTATGRQSCRSISCQQEARYTQLQGDIATRASVASRRPGTHSYRETELQEHQLPAGGQVHTATGRHSYTSISCQQEARYTQLQGDIATRASVASRRPGTHSYRETELQEHQLPAGGQVHTATGRQSCRSISCQQEARYTQLQGDRAAGASVASRRPGTHSYRETELQEHQLPAGGQVHTATGRQSCRSISCQQEARYTQLQGDRAAGASVASRRPGTHSYRET